MQAPWQHQSVLLDEAVEAIFSTHPGELKRASGLQDGCYVDATFGRGGHARQILKGLSAQGRLIAFDRDPEAVLSAQALGDSRLTMRHASFSHLDELEPASVSGLLMDLGVSSPQIDNPARGFSFRLDGPLDMRMDPSQGESAAQWLARASVQEIAEVIRDYGEERFAVPIAKALVARREERGPVSSTTELAQLVAGAVKTREPGQNPATRTFQALRIHVNAELEELQQALMASLDVLAPGGRLVVISFHSLEDRIVKQFMTRHSREQVDRRSPAWLKTGTSPMKLQHMLRRRPGAAEVATNARARSAVMRVAWRTAA